MLARALVLALAVTSAALADTPTPPRVTCNEVTPDNTLTYSDLLGRFALLEKVSFKDGHPFTPENDQTPQICGVGNVHETSDTGFKVTVDSHCGGRSVQKEEFGVTVIGEEKGRLSATSDVHDRENWEFVVLDQDASKYLVYLLCLPPNEAGERLPARTSLLTRLTDNHEQAISAEELEAIHTRVGEKLHLTGSGVVPVKFAKDCWGESHQDHL